MQSSRGGHAAGDQYVPFPPPERATVRMHARHSNRRRGIVSFALGKTNRARCAGCCAAGCSGALHGDLLVEPVGQETAVSAVRVVTVSQRRPSELFVSGARIKQNVSQSLGPRRLIRRL